MVYTFFDKKCASLDKSKGSGIINEPNYQLTNELHKTIIRKFRKRKVYSSFRDNIWGVDLADMHSLSKYNKEIKYLLCVIDLLSKYAWLIPIKDKKGTSIVHLLMHLKKHYVIRIENQIKYGLIKLVSFITNLLEIF